MLEFTLELNPGPYAPTQSPEATVSLHNTGPDPVRVNRRLLLNHPAEIEECREVFARIHDGAGAELPFKARLRVNELALDDFAVLAPGESVKQTYNLQTYYALPRPGTYSVQAFYENRFDTTDGEAWKGRLESNTVTCQLS